MSSPCPASHKNPAIAAGLQTGEGPAKCTWDINKPGQQSPHVHISSVGAPKIGTSILDFIGNTPMVKLNAIPQSEGIECEMLAKCEYFNAGGSVKDRIGKRMILDAEASGRIKPGDVLIEPTSGNTGIGMALTAAVKGYRMIITLPEKMSQEKVDVLKAFGAEIIRTPTEAAFDSPDSHIGVAKKLNKEIANSHILDQYANPSNPLAHYDGTAEEILAQCDGKVDVVVASAGTGGTISGIARKLKERLPHVRIVGVDPVGSILALPETLNGEIAGYKVEGIGYDFIPTVLDRALVDEWIKTVDKESFTMSRRLIREEGMLVGGSAGATMAAAVKVAKTMKKGERLVVLFADSVRNYMTKFLNDNWMIENGFMEPKQDVVSMREWWSDRPVSELQLNTPITVAATVTCSECVDILNKNGYDQLPCVNDRGEVEGMVTLGNLTSQILSGRIKPTDPISKVLYRQFIQVPLTTKLSALSKIFDKDHFALVTTKQKNYSSPAHCSEKTLVYGVVTRIDLLNHILHNSPKKE
jgi:cystathionine beta-synthase